VGENILFRAFCALADGAVSPIQSTLTHFMDEYDAHIRDGRCPVTGIGPGRDAAAPEQEAVSFAATGPFEIQGANP
jgi:NADH-quinone oxidoreductase subunit F